MKCPWRTTTEEYVTYEGITIKNVEWAKCLQEECPFYSVIPTECKRAKPEVSKEMKWLIKEEE